MTITEAFRRVRESAGASQAEFAQAIGISQSYVSQIESGARVNISERAVRAIAELLPVSDKAMADLHAAIARGREVAVVRNEATSDVVVPMLTQDIHAGDPMPVVADDAESFTVTKHYRDTLVVRVVGDSMTGLGIVAGDKLVVRRADRFRNGDIVLALCDGEYILKQAYHAGDAVRFVPANPDYQEFTRPASDVQIVGVVIETIRKIGRLL